MLKVDEFRKTQQDQCQTACYVLTHAHTDHNAFPKSFPCVVYCTPITKYLIDLSSDPKPTITLSATLKEWEWCSVGTQSIYCFPNHHCMGSLGFYAPVESVLYFGDGRPDKETQAHLQEVINEHPPQTKLRVVIDDFFQINYPKVDERVIVPTEKQSRKMLRDFLRVSLQHSTPIHIRVAHFGSLNVLPNVSSNIQYVWLGEGLTCGSRLAQAAFELRFADHKSKPAAKKIYVSRVHDDLTETIPECVTIVLSAMWFFQHNHTRNLFRIRKNRERNTLQLCVCAHASPKEVQLLHQRFQLPKEQS